MDHSTALLQMLEIDLSHVDASRYMTIAGFTILIWDHICTFEDEVRLIWPTPLSTVKVLFFVNRYSTPVFQAITAYQMSRLGVFSDIFCKRWTIVNGYAEVISVAISNLLLLLRVHALWGRRRSILILLLSLYAVTYTILIVVTTISIVQLAPLLYYSPIAKICVSNTRPRMMAAIWAAPLVFEVLAFSMTAIKAIEHARADQIRTPLLKSLYRDQFLYYFIIIVVRVFNLIVWNILPASLLFLGLFFIWSLITALVSRIMLNLREVGNAQEWARETAFYDASGGGNLRRISATRVVWAPQFSELDSYAPSGRVPDSVFASTSSAVHEAGVIEMEDWVR